MKRKYNPENQPKAWLFLFPALLIVFIFNIYPMFRAIWLSLQKGSLINQSFTGLDNFKRVLTDPTFHKALKNTAIYAFCVVPISMVISLLIAWLIYAKVRHKAFFETVFFMPYVTSTLAIGIVFRYFFNYDHGIINYVLSWFNIGPINWLDDVKMSMPTVIIFGVWLGLAFNIIILLAGLRNVPKEHITLAKMYGASNWEIFYRVILGQLKPTITFLLTVNLISSFKVYTEVYALFGGKAGLANSAITAVYYIYDLFYVRNRPGQAMAASVILFVIILIFTRFLNFILAKIGGDD